MQIEKLRSFLTAPKEFGVVPFWFLNHYPEEDQLRQQIREMAARHCGGIMLHARDGLMGGYLNAHWEKTCRIAIDEAKKQNLSVWLYDELNFPSGPAGDQIFDHFPQTAMQSLELVLKSDVLPEEKFDKILEYNGKYLCFSLKKQHQYPDYLDEKAMEKFVELSYSWYARRFREDLGSVIKGEFTDNACANFGFYRNAIPWTDAMPEKFRRFCGKELDTILPDLFLDTSSSALHRVLFWRFFNKLFLQTFICKIEKECARNHIAATGHYCIEDGTSEHVRQLGDRFDQKRHQQLPGVDMLGAPTFEELKTFPFGTASALLAMTASPAYFFHNSRVLCECLGLTLKWAVNLAEMRRLTAILSVLGADLFVPHGLYYSIGGHRKRECVPDFYHNTLWEEFDYWSLFAARLSALTAHGLHIAETALLYPVLSQQGGLKLGPDTGERCLRIDKAMRRSADLLLSAAVPFEIVDEKIIRQAEIKDGELLISLPSGKIHYLRTVILPSVWLLEEKTAEKLAAFARLGGRIILLEEKPVNIFDGEKISSFVLPKDFAAGIFEDFNSGASDQNFLLLVQSGLSRSRIHLANTGGKILLREWFRPDGQYFALLQNQSTETLKDVQISCDFDPVILDIDTLEMFRAPGKVIQKDFTYGETFILTQTDGKLPLLPEKKKILSVFPLKIKEWQTTLYSPNAWRLPEMTCSGNAATRTFKTTFEIAQLPRSLGIALDVDPTEAELRSQVHPFIGNGPVHPRHRCVVRINGQRVENISYGKNFDRHICEADILPLVREGKNTIELEQCHARFETTRSIPEPFMLTGDFGVRENKIVPAPETLPECRWDHSVLQHYSGKIRFTAQFSLPPHLRGKICALQLQEVHEFCSLHINGVFCGKRLMAPWLFEFDPALTDQEEISLSFTCVNTPANRWEEPIASGISGEILLLCKEK